MGRFNRKDKLKFAVIRYIESELRDYEGTKRELEELRTDIIEAAPVVDEEGGNSIQQMSG